MNKTSLEKIHPFQVGGMEGGVRPHHFNLASNEETLGPSPKVAEIYPHLIDHVHLYPDTECQSIRQKISDAYSIPIDMILMGNGSEEFLYALPRLMTSPGYEILFHQYSFPVYEIGALCAQATPRAVPDTGGFRATADGFIDALTTQTRLIFIDNPGNPTGAILTRDDLVNIIKATPSSILIVIDSAYGEYVSDDSYTMGHEFVETYPNVVVLRTFSKFYGLAGMRLGWIHGSQDIILNLKKTQAPFHVNTLVQRMAEKVLEDTVHPLRVRARNVEQKKMLTECFQEKGFFVYPSHTNFLVVCDDSSDKGDTLAHALNCAGILTRRLHGFGLPHYFRISIGSDAANSALQDMLRENF